MAWIYKSYVVFALSNMRCVDISARSKKSIYMYLYDVLEG